MLPNKCTSAQEFLGPRHIMRMFDCQTRESIPQKVSRWLWNNNPHFLSDGNHKSIHDDICCPFSSDYIFRQCACSLENPLLCHASWMAWAVVKVLYLHMLYAVWCRFRSPVLWDQDSPEQNKQEVWHRKFDLPPGSWGSCLSEIQRPGWPSETQWGSNLDSSQNNLCAYNMMHMAFLCMEFFLSGERGIPIYPSAARFPWQSGDQLRGGESMGHCHLDGHQLQVECVQLDLHEWDRISDWEFCEQVLLVY